MLYCIRFFTCRACLFHSFFLSKQSYLAVVGPPLHAVCLRIPSFSQSGYSRSASLIAHNRIQRHRISRFSLQIQHRIHRFSILRHCKVHIAALCTVIFRRFADISNHCAGLQHISFLCLKLFQTTVSTSVVPVSSSTYVDSTIPFAAASTWLPVSLPITRAGLYLYWFSVGK